MIERDFNELDFDYVNINDKCIIPATPKLIGLYQNQFSDVFKITGIEIPPPLVSEGLEIQMHEVMRLYGDLLHPNESDIPFYELKILPDKIGNNLASAKVIRVHEFIYFRLTQAGANRVDTFSPERDSHREQNTIQSMAFSTAACVLGPAMAIGMPQLIMDNTIYIPK